MCAPDGDYVDCDDYDHYHDYDDYDDANDYDDYCDYDTEHKRLGVCVCGPDEGSVSFIQHLLLSPKTHKCHHCAVNIREYNIIYKDI